MIRSILPALALATFAVSTSTQEQGDRLPPFEIEDLHQTGASAYEDFFGRAMLVEFFAHWCGPCGQQVPHLNEIYDEYTDSGLSIVSLTGGQEDKEKTEAWITKRRAKYAWGYDPDGSLMATLNIRSIPHAVLLDANRNIVWRGHPGALTDEHIATAVKGALATPLWENEGASEVRSALAARRYGTAMAAAQKLGEEHDGPRLTEFLKKHVENRMRAISSAREMGDYLGAQEMAETAARELAGLPEAVAAAEVVAELAKDEEAQAVIQAQLEFRRVMNALLDVATRAEAEPHLQELMRLAREHEGTIVEKRIRALLKRAGVQEAPQRAG